MLDRPRTRLLAAVGVALAVATLAPASAAVHGRHERRLAAPAPAVAGRLLVKFADRSSPDHIRLLERSVDATEIGAIDELAIHILSVTDHAVDDVTKALERFTNVQYVEPDFVADAQDVIPNDPYFPWSGSGVIYGGQWGDGLTQAPKAWDLTTGSSNVIVAVVDSGIDAAHPDLAGRVIAGTSIIGGSTVDTHGHGEEVAGVISTNTDNALGVAGYCWNCLLMPVKISGTGTATYSDLSSGIIWAANHGARVINVSYGGTSRSSTLDAAVQYATDHGAIVVASAGNSGCNCPNYPAASPGAVGVAASDQFDNLMTYSNYGSWVEVAAPTGDITTTLKDPKTGAPYGYAPIGGTSISAPVVSGILALMFSLDPSATPAAVEQTLFSTTDPITGVTQAGLPVSVEYGRANAYSALLAMAGVATPSPTPLPSPSSSTSPTVSPSPSAAPGPSPSPTVSASPTLVTTTFSGAVNRKNGSRTFSIAIGTGTADAALSFAKCRSLGLALKGSDGTVVGSSTGPSVVTLDTSVAGGSYAYTVSGTDQCSFTLTVTVPA
jgi:thermitase